jgi:hypothetical protein
VRLQARLSSDTSLTLVVVLGIIVLEERPEDTGIKGNLASVLEDRAGPGDLARALQLVKEG